MPVFQRSCCLHSCWLIAIDLSDSATPQKYHLTRDVYERSSLRQPSFSQHYIIQKLPSYMNNAAVALKNNSIHCSFCAEALLTSIGKLAMNSCYSVLCTRFDSEESFIDHCVEVVCCGYIGHVIKHGENRLLFSETNFINFLERCKIMAMNKRTKRLSDENYLGKSSFSDESSLFSRVYCHHC
jgi:hypothetical protein